MKKLTLLISLFVVVSCATTYQNEGFSGGYTETQLDVDVYSVVFNGNGFTSLEKTKDFTLLRSAELTLNKGYKFFIIINTSSFIDKNQGSIPVQTYNYSTQSYNTTQQQFTTSKPKSSNTIKMLKKKPSNTFSYNAEFLVRSIMARYEIE